MKPDLNCISTWYPPLQDAGVPMPRTYLVPAPRRIETYGHAKELASRFKAYGIDTFKPKCFIRTGHSAFKHSWSKTCFIADFSLVGLTKHIWEMVELSECAGIMGLPFDTWAIREYMPGESVGTWFDGMPVRREFRAFVRDGEVECIHPYWPEDAFEGIPSRFLDVMPKHSEGVEREELVLAHQLVEELVEIHRAMLVRRVRGMNEIGDDSKALMSLARKAGKALSGLHPYWSVDMLATPAGWCVTDCALGEQSFHWPECKNAEEAA